MDTKDCKCKKLPVLVSVHGGAYILGSGILKDASSFMRDGVIMVSMNYRLGRLGQFAHLALRAESPTVPLGSYVVTDQVAALEWVKCNIFGGDAGKVSILGCSAEGTYVDLLMASPKARGLFRSAIAQPDPFNTPWPRLQRMGPDKSGSAEEQGVAFARSIGLNNATAADLRAILPAELGGGVANTPNLRIQPIVDEQYVAVQGINSFWKGATAKVPYINSINGSEGMLALLRWR